MRVCAAFLLLLTVLFEGRGGVVPPPTAANPMLPPFFAIDPNSPELAFGYSPAQVLLPFDPFLPQDPNYPFNPLFPIVVFEPRQLGLVRADDLDALSLTDPVSSGIEFALTFSVDRRAQGAVAPDPNLVAAGFSFNVADQAAKTQEAGDAYMVTRRFNRSGPLSLLRGPGGNNTLVINQGDAGGVDFSARPLDGPQDPASGPVTNVNGGAGSAPNSALTLTGRGVPLPRKYPQRLFFSLAAGSPTLKNTTIPGSTGSGADVYVDNNTFSPLGQNTFAAHFQLGLQHDDDIDALIVFENGNHTLDSADQFIFSLAPGSPSLGSTLSAGDVFVVSPGSPPSLFCAAELLGLVRQPGAPGNGDNVDMLDFLPCADLRACIEDWAIGTPPCPGDVDGDSDIDLTDLSLLLSAYGFGTGDPAYNPAADFNHNGVIDLPDLSILLANFGGNC